MKIWKFYLKVPLNEYGNKISMLISNHRDYQNDGNGNKIGLYAWTTDKEIKNGFLKTRNIDTFIIRKENIDKYELQDMKDSHLNQYLDFREYKTFDDNNKEKTVNVISTLDEHVASTSDFDGRENIECISKINYKANIPYNCFNDKVLSALDSIGLLDDYISHGGTSEDMECMYHNNSYGLTFLGRKNIMKQALVKYFDEIRILLFLFEYTFSI